ncbi:replication initiation protein, partial [Vibrio parahaemolyticus]|uniref:replication initiation protein n=1 Tax=Vibrio parahaemolyticus TaxID=670 RepID=UPI00215283FD
KLVTYLVFDIDRQGGVLAWYDNDLPTPYWTSKNPENAHAHIAYRLKVPFCTSDIAHSEPIRYAAAIESAMIERLNLDLKGHPLRGSETSGLGRNCELFDNTRQWAYRAIREYWAPNYKRKWNAAVYDSRQKRKANGTLRKVLRVEKFQKVEVDLALTNLGLSLVSV